MRHAKHNPASLNPEFRSRREVLLGLGAVSVTACTAPSTSAGDMSPERVETATSGWSTSTPLPLAVQEIYPTALQGRIHLAGGFVAESGAITGPTNAHQVFDPERGAWSAGLPLPTARHHPHLIAFDGHLIALGGFETPSADAIWVMQSSGWAITADMATWESAAGENAPMESWASVPTLPRPAGEAVTAVIDANLHLVGGRRPAAEANATWQDHTDTSEHFILGGLDSVWETAAPIPTARNSAAASMIGENWHVVGGRTVADGNTSAHEVYDAREDRWRTVAPLPQGQGGLAAASLGGKLYAFGGEYFQPSPGGVFSESWVYSPNEDAWSSIPEMPSPRHGLGAVTLNDEIYVIGGALGVGGQETSARVEIFTPQ